MASASSTQAEAESSDVNLKTILWSHVEILNSGEASGGNVKWRCKYCSQESTSGYSRVKAHLLKISNQGIGSCPKVTVPILAQLKAKVKRAEELEETIEGVFATHCLFYFFKHDAGEKETQGASLST